MQTPWFLEFLGLGTDADLPAIKRAYAQRLKQIDQATDIPAFMRLRQAFEAARHWQARDACDMPASSSPAPESLPMPDEQALRDATPTPARAAFDELRARRAPGDAPEPTEAHAESPRETAAAQAKAAFDVLRNRLASGQTPAQALRHGLGHLRDSRLEAPALFEAMLLEQLANRQLPRRLELFHAAQEHLHWNDLGHLRGLGRWGEWILAMATEEFHWERAAQFLGSQDLLDRMGNPPNLARSGLTASDFPRSAVLRWPDMLVLLARFPGYLSLRAEASALTAWEKAFETLSVRDRAMAEASTNLPGFAPDSISAPAARTRGNPRWLMAGIVMLMMIVGGLLQ